MPLICYVERKFTPSSLRLIEQASEIMTEYEQAGYKLTLRQLYYQFVSRDLVENTMRSYKNLGSVVNDARLAGLLDWDTIEDRTRNLQKRARWDTPADIVQACAEQYHVDYWKGQDYRVEVWIEKDALTGVIEGVCDEWDVPYFACRGYSSQSEQWRAGMRFADIINGGQKVCLLHLGDHDPSGIDMTRDNEDRLRQFIAEHADADRFEVRRLALNMDQVKRYRPPPNPAKLTDSRASGYLATHGNKSWELDALDPPVINGLISAELEDLVGMDAFDERKELEHVGRQKLLRVARSKTMKEED